jgi:hypothetical protein
MKKTMYCVLTVAMLVLASAAFAQDKPAAEQPKEQVKQTQPAAPAATSAPDVKAKMRERVAGEQPPQAPALRQGPRDMIAAEIAKLQQEHKTAVDELQKIKLLAVEEKATKTTEALTALIAKHDAQFEQQMQVLQRRMSMLQGTQETKPGAQVQPPTKPVTTAQPEPKKDTDKKTQ